MTMPTNQPRPEQVEVTRISSIEGTTVHCKRSEDDRGREVMLLIKSGSVVASVLSDALWDANGNLFDWSECGKQAGPPPPLQCQGCGSPLPKRGSCEPCAEVERVLAMSDEEVLAQSIPEDLAWARGWKEGWKAGQHARPASLAPLAEVEKLREHIAEQITHVEQRIKDGTEMGAAVWRIALEDVARENRTMLAAAPDGEREG